jgi:PEP-CTERM motif
MRRFSAAKTTRLCALGRGRLALGILLFSAWAAVAPGKGQAVPIEYIDHVWLASISLGSISYTCDSVVQTGCAEVTIIAFGDTSRIQSFSVPGANGSTLAYGYTNWLDSASLDVTVFPNGIGGPGVVSYHANFNPHDVGFVVAVDNQNLGVGFSSIYSPTYPLATFYDPTEALSAPSGLMSYNLASNFLFEGWWPYCPPNSTAGEVCLFGYPIPTDVGDFIVTPAYDTEKSLADGTIVTAITAAYFKSIVLEPPPVIRKRTETDIPEPSTLWILGAGAAAILARRRATVQT